MEEKSYQELSRLENNHWWFVARRKILEHFIKKFSNQNNILEIGAGTGGNLEMLGKYGKVFAVEPNEFARKKIQEKLGNQITLISDRLPDLINIQDKFNLICLFDVLEHIKDDRAALKRIKEILNPNGKIIITIPAFQFLYGKHDKELHHFRRYNKYQIKKLADELGFEVIKLSYFNFFLFPLAVFMRLFFPKNSGTKEMKSVKLNQLLTAIFSSEKFYLPKFNFPFGLSLICILQHPTN